VAVYPQRFVASVLLVAGYDALAPDMHISLPLLSHADVSREAEEIDHARYDELRLWLFVAIATLAFALPSQAQGNIRTVYLVKVKSGQEEN